MGYDISRFQEDVDEELICPICSGVLEDPLQTPLCEHTFCKICINEWLSRQFSCPVDRESITPNDLKAVPRILRNLLSRLLITCDNASLGCTAVVKLERLKIHHQGCAYNPNRHVSCVKGCGIIVHKDKLEDHNCIREIRLMLQNQQIGMKDILLQINEVRGDIGLLKSCVQEYLGAARVNSYVPRVLESSEDETIRWLSSLPRARVKHWGAMISSPESVLQAMVRRALVESGCPSHLTDGLMKNAHERGWPSGLSTLETRQANRIHYRDYISKRIPEKQAVVVMAIENRHMNYDMVLEPGLVMIFAHGIE